MTEGLGLEFRRLREGDEDGLSQLFQEVFGDGKSAAYWHWKYHECPAGRHKTMVALDSSRLVGIIGNIPVKAKAGDRVVLAAQGVDTAVAEAHRKRGTFFTLEGAVRQHMISDHVAFSYAFSIKETYRIFTQALGFTGVCPVFNMSKVINPKPYLGKKLRGGMLTDLLGSVGKQAIATLNRKKLSVPPGLEIKDVTYFDRRFDDFWQREGTNYDIAVVRDSHYLNWRYMQSPLRYKAFCVASGETIKGFVVLGCFKEDVNRGRIIDIMVEYGRRDIADLLLTHSINYFIDHRVDVITCWMLEHWTVFEALKQRNFVPRETPYDLMIRSYTEALKNEYLADASRWYLTMGDSDYFT